MTDPDNMVVVDRDGVRGAIVEPDNADSPFVLIRVQDGRTVLAERALLAGDSDAERELPLSFAELRQAGEDGEPLVLPVMEEEVRVETRQVEDGRVRIAKTVEERDVLIDQPLTQERVEVNRVVVNRMVDQPPEIRYEGDTMIIPVLEEVVVAEIKLMVREEVHVTRVREEVHQPQSVSIRREDVQVEREPDNGADHP